MTLNSNFFFIIDCFGFMNKTPNGFDLFVFGIGAIILISLLSIYYSLIEKKSSSSTYVKLEETPIYQTKDVLLQEKSLGLELMPSKIVTSVWVKAVVFILIFIMAVTPIYEMLGVYYY
ncbi:hypothetical protein [Tenacibaculum ascidiaceicola]|uniref:hypothetical protein n=1 Tax=Tenacibaculum ascidiaceicola TaxID=1699411 RepID=UPI003CE52C1C